VKKDLEEAREELETAYGNQKKIKRELHERENELESERIEFQRKLNEERRKAVYVEEDCTRIRTSYEEKKKEMVDELQEKEELIHNLKKELSDSRKV